MRMLLDVELCMYIDMSTYAYAHIYIYIYIYVYMYTCVITYVYLPLSQSARVYTGTRVLTHFKF